MQQQTLTYFQSRREDQATPTDEQWRPSCVHAEERLDVCQWLAELRALYMSMRHLPATVTAAPHLTDGLFLPDADTCFKRDSMCVGDDLVNYLNVGSAVHCWQLCVSERAAVVDEEDGNGQLACDCFTYREEDQKCFLKKDARGFEKHANRVSGPRACAAAAN